MKVVILFFCVVVAVALAGEMYTTKYDNIDVDQILNNKRTLDQYLKCLKGQGVCTEEGKLLKEIIPEAMTNECAKCNDHQKKMTKKVIRFLATMRADDWNELSKMYDPTGKYKAQYEKLITED